MNGKNLKLWTASVVHEAGNGVPGEILEAGKEGLLVKTGDGLLLIQELQLEGKKRMQVRDFLLGCRIEKGEMLGC